jgi:hypothetical protein
MPKAWNTATLENVEIADNSVSVFYNRNEGEVELKVVQQNTNWTVEIVIPKTDFKNYEVDNTKVSVEELGYHVVFKTKSSDVILKLKR